VGDVVAYRIPAGDLGAGKVVIHRIKKVEANGQFTTQGDNRRGADQWHPTKNDVVGTPWVHVPGGRRVLARLASPLFLAAAAFGFAVYCVLAPSRSERRRNAVAMARGR
jgi:hypothetical protein